MKRANDIRPAESAWARKMAENSGASGSEFGADEPIYKARRMRTVPLMIKRILTLAAGVFSESGSRRRPQGSGRMEPLAQPGVGPGCGTGAGGAVIGKRELCR